MKQLNIFDMFITIILVVLIAFALSLTYIAEVGAGKLDKLVRG